MTPTEAISNKITLKMKLFIHVSSGIMGWNRQQKGILIPNLMLPFWTLQSMYKQKYAKINVDKNPTSVCSN
jgi:hypothetical protein